MRITSSSRKEYLKRTGTQRAGAIAALPPHIRVAQIPKNLDTLCKTYKQKLPLAAGDSRLLE